MASEIKSNISLKQLKRIFPEFEDILFKTGHSEVARAMASMPKTANYTLSNLSRAAGLTEIEIGLLVDKLNERNDIGKTRKRIQPKVRFKGGTRKTKSKVQK